MFNLSPIPMPDLSGKVVLITGAGRGIGAAAARALVGQGARVFAAHQPGRPFALPAGDGIETLPLDVTSDADVHAAVARISDSAGQLDALINNAGLIAPIGRLTTLGSGALAPAFDVNVMGVHRMTCAALGLLQASGGVVINAGTGAATTPMEGWTAYCTSKAAARMLTAMCALELAGSGVQFFFLGIPPTDTDMQGEIRTAGLNPISRIARADLVAPEVTASIMAWLCGPGARALTEVMVDVRDDHFRAMMQERHDV